MMGLADELAQVQRRWVARLLSLAKRMHCCNTTLARRRRRVLSMIHACNKNKKGMACHFAPFVSWDSFPIVTQTFNL